MRQEFCASCFGTLFAGQDCVDCARGGVATEDEDILPQGTLLAGKYRIGRLLGRGGFGATYLTHDENLRVRVAVKEFMPMGMAGRAAGSTQIIPYTTRAPEYRTGLAGFLAEAQTLAQFRGHSVIVSVLDFFPANGTGYMVMEYIDGITLLRYAEDRRIIDPSLALRLLMPVADALRSCHAVGLIHRDIAPDNIFLTVDDTVKLLDFGAARQLLGERSQSLDSILKPGYAPIEQYASRGQGPWTDVYALTATLYRVITGIRPPSAPDRSIAGAEMVLPSAMGIALPPGLEAVIVKGMALNRQDRFQDMVAVRDALLPLLAGSREERDGASRPRTGDDAPPTVTPTGRARSTARSPVPAGATRPWRGRIMAGSGIGVLLLGLAAYLWVSHQPPAPAPAVRPAAPIPATTPGASPPGASPPAASQIDAARAAIAGANRLLGNLLEEQNDMARNSQMITQLQAVPGFAAQISAARQNIKTDQSQFSQDEDSYYAALQQLNGVDPSTVSAALHILTVDAAADQTATANLALIAGHLAAARAGTLTDGQIGRDIQQRLQ
jgi:serine/threonine protein kinase